MWNCTDTLLLDESKLVEKEEAATPIQNMYSFWYIKRTTGNKAVSVRILLCK